jgi:GT2 family glycosyltransferase
MTPGDSAAWFAAPAPGTHVEPGPRPTFSVVVAAWQAASTIGAALDSVQQQSEPPLEVIMVDDGSTDDLAGSLRRFGDAVRLVRIEHRGPSVARNVSVDLAHGEFVVILDADDRWEPERLGRLGDLAAARPDLEMLTTDAWFLVGDRRRGRFCEANPFEVADQAAEILRRNFLFGHLAVRRETWHRFGGMDPSLSQAEDWDLWLRMLVGGCRAGCVLEPLADYRIHGSSASADRSGSLRARVQVLDRAEARMPLTDAQRRVLNEARTLYRRRAALARAEHALLEGLRERRRACLAVLVVPGATTHQRLFAAAAALAPGLARARLRREVARAGRARTDRVVREVEALDNGASALDGHDQPGAGRSPGDPGPLDRDGEGHQG